MKYFILTLLLTFGTISISQSGKDEYTGEPSLRTTDWKKEHYTDKTICQDRENDVFIARKDSTGNILFTGVCRNGKVWSGEMFFYDKDEVLLTVELWHKGKPNWVPPPGVH